MNRRQRLMATIRGSAVDRPPVSFYEIGGFAYNPEDPNPFNVHNDPSWRPLLHLAEERTDLIRMLGIFGGVTSTAASQKWSEYVTNTCYISGQSRFVRTEINARARILTSLTRRDADTDTTWTLEHLLKDPEDLLAYLDLPNEVVMGEVGVPRLYDMEQKLGDGGIVMFDVADPICLAASLFSMEDYLVVALMEPQLFHRLLEKFAKCLYPAVTKVAAEHPGHLWRVVGPEYATEPYLPPRLFEEYVVRYTGPLVRIIRERGGFPRIHCHGRVRNVLRHFVEMGVTAVDPVEPPPLGDITLSEARREYGKDLVIFGNIEVRDIEVMQQLEFRKVVEASLRDGTDGDGLGFVLMPSSAPYGRHISPNVLANYETMIEMVEGCASKSDHTD